MQLKDSVVLVTGASSGIGRATAIRLAEAGAHVLVHGRDAARVKEVAAQVRGVPLVSDLAQPGNTAALAQEALSVYDRVDVLVNNAGVGWSGPLVKMDDEISQQLLSVGLVAPVALTRALLPGMIARRSGAVCFVGSIAGRAGVAGEAVYAGVKAGLDGFADSLRLELAGSGLTVAVVVPGAVRTPFFDKRGRAYGRSIPRPVEPEAVAAALVAAIRTGRAEVYVPSWLRLAVLAKAVAPTWFNRLAVRFGEPVRATDGPDRGEASPT
ncbi:MAG TPA: SDR family NAD(P)-dependent oxidoreductase [Kribbella sp.]|nr:SDR family NAD(P)-dependent oxidoreductase [Kribbella sp.]